MNYEFLRNLCQGLYLVFSALSEQEQNKDIEDIKKVVENEKSNKTR